LSALLQTLIELCEDMAKGSYVRHQELFELTKTGSYPEDVRRLAESFGMMMVRVEAREFHLAYIIDDLKRTKTELAQAKRQLDLENRALKKTIRDTFSADRILGKSRAIQEIKNTVQRIANTSVNVLISGETGTGKDLIARSIHYLSSRSDKPFVALNCSAIPESMLESELFGIEKGVATGVDKRIGKIEQASGGTLFLDEIGDMPLNAQAKILRVLEERVVERVGGRVAIPVDVRLIAATNKTLADEVSCGAFRRDLYYRLNVVQLTVPPLRQRKDDISLLLAEFMSSCAAGQGSPQCRFAPGLLEMLAEYPWPGNVRQLKNEVERLIALAGSDVVGFDDLSEEVRTFFRGREIPQRGIGENLKNKEMQAIRDILRETGGNKSEAARRLGVSREGLRKKLARYGIDA
jgi:transcriptional regulator with PAS, ATPase and Fis domain